MSERAIAVAIEPGPAAFAALRVAADLAARLRRPLQGFAIPGEGIPTLRAYRRLKLTARRRNLESSFVRPAGDDLLAVSEGARDAALLVVARSRGRGAPRLSRRLLLGRLIRRPGPPLLVLTGRGRPLGERVLVACADGAPPARDALYDVVKPLVSRVSILRWLAPGGELENDPGLDACIAGALAWDERIVHGDEGHELGDAVLATVDRVHPTLVALTRPAAGPGMAALLAPGAADRVLCESPAPVLVARMPASVREAVGPSPISPSAGSAIAA